MIYIGFVRERIILWISWKWGICVRTSNWSRKTMHLAGVSQVIARRESGKQLKRVQASLKILKPSLWSFYAQILDFALRKVKYYQCEYSCWEQCKWWSVAVAGLLVTKRVLHQFEQFTAWSGAGLVLAKKVMVEKNTSCVHRRTPLLELRTHEACWCEFSWYRVVLTKGHRSSLSEPGDTDGLDSWTSCLQMTAKLLRQVLGHS